MTEITNENFEEMFPIIKEAINRSAFIAVDTELTGLVYSSDCTPTLFDTLEERYRKQRQSVSKFIVCQFGLSLFSKDFNSNIYQTKTYHFYLCPRSVAKTSVSFVTDCSALEFLLYNNFDFNKFANGINYLNESEEENLRQNFDKYLKIDFKECPLKVDDSTTQISNWMTARMTNNKSIGNQLVLKCSPTVNPLVNYAFVIELRKTFTDTSVWIQETDNRFVVKSVDLEERLQLVKNEENERQLVINKMLGFSSVFKCLIDSKRPIVGHNMIIDLLMIYHHFYRPLPPKLKQFKAGIHSIFPYIFDTKCILFNEKQNLMEIWEFIKTSSLGDIYLKLSDEQIMSEFFGSPKVEQLVDNNHIGITDYCPHNAGFDAFATGFVFIKIGFILMTKNEKNSDVILTHSWFDLLKAIEMHCNKINLIRANSHYLCLTETEPISNRPDWLYARHRTYNSNQLMTKLTSFLSESGTSDIRSNGDKGVLIAVNSHRIAASIWESVQEDPDMKVTKYDTYKHNPKIRSILWSIITISTTFTAVMTIQLIKCFRH